MLNDVYAFIEQINTLQQAELVWAEFLRFTSRFGFTHGGLADMPGPGERLQDTILCMSWPEKWRQRYFEENYIVNDPARLHLMQSVEPYSWQQMVSYPAYSRRQKNIVHEASEFRMNGGLIFPMLGRNSGLAMVTIAGEHQDLGTHDFVNLHVAAIYTHAMVRRLSHVRAEAETPPSFSSRERECLQWHAAGKSDWEIGEILSISAKSANTYIERAKQKFGVATRMQAVVAGLRVGVIHY